MPTNLKSAHKILHSPSAGLQAILEKAAILEQINHELSQHLGDPLNQHIVLANVREDKAILLADTSVWLTKARYKASNILKFLSQDLGLQKLKKIQFKIRHLSPDPQAPTIAPCLSAQAAQILASADIDDPKLKGAIQQISNNFHPKV